MTTITGHTTRASGTILTAAIYNADHVNHVTNSTALNTGKIEGVAGPVVDGEGILWSGTGGATVKTAGYVPLNPADEKYKGTEAEVSAKPNDLVPLSDTSDSDNSKMASAQSIAECGRMSIDFNLFGAATAVVTGDVAGEVFFVAPAELDGMEITEVFASHFAASSGASGTTTINIRRDGSDILTTALTIDADEVSSATAATPAVIDTGEDAIAEGDIIVVDVDAIPSGGTGPDGLVVTITCEVPVA